MHVPKETQVAFTNFFKVWTCESNYNKNKDKSINAFFTKTITNDCIICTQLGFQTIVLKEDVTTRSTCISIFGVKMQFAYPFRTF